VCIVLGKTIPSMSRSNGFLPAQTLSYRIPPDREKAKGQPSSTDGSLQDAVEKPDAAKKKKGSDVRSALSAAFAKYPEKIRSQGHDAANEAGEGTSSSTMEVAVGCYGTREMLVRAFLLGACCSTCRKFSYAPLL
jgi:hypothetical protein